MDTFVSERPDSARMKTYAQLSLGISAFFWIWAAKNTYEMEQGLDLGIVSFFTVMISSIMLLLKKSDDPNLKIHRFAAVGSHVFVSLNYLLGLLFALTIDSKILYGFGTYCFLFAILWAKSAHYGYETITYHMERVVRENAEMENLYNFERRVYSGIEPSS